MTRVDVVKKTYKHTSVREKKKTSSFFPPMAKQSPPTSHRLQFWGEKKCIYSTVRKSTCQAIVSLPAASRASGDTSKRPRPGWRGIPMSRGVDKRDGPGCVCVCGGGGRGWEEVEEATGAHCLFYFIFFFCLFFWLLRRIVPPRSNVQRVGGMRRWRGWREVLNTTGWRRWRSDDLPERVEVGMGGRGV